MNNHGYRKTGTGFNSVILDNAKIFLFHGSNSAI